MSSLEITEKPQHTIQELYKNPELSLEEDKLAYYLNQQPPASWVKVHPFIRGYKYLPIDKIEFLLKRLFKKYHVEILREGVAFNGVYVVVRVHYRDILTSQMVWQDGIGAFALQVASGTSPADLANINNGALSMAFPLAETIAIKDATDKIGDIFGANLNRKDVIGYELDAKLETVVKKSAEEKRLTKLIESASSLETLELLREHLTESTQSIFSEKWSQLEN